MDESSDVTAGIYARESSYLDRYVQLGIAGNSVVSVSFPGTPADNAETELGLLDRVIAYLEGETDDFADVEIALTVSGENRAVLEATREIPYGQQVTVERLTRMIPTLTGEENGETVRTALAENPIPLLIPDHRVRDGPSAAPPEIEQLLRNLEEL